MIKKVSIIGSGAVGSTIAFHILSKLNLNDLVLVDTVSDLAKGVALDLEDTRAFLKFSTKLYAGDDFSFIQNSDIVVITAGIPRKEGMTRLDLIKINAKIAKEVSGNIKKFSEDSIVIVITNPLDIITYVVTKLTGISRHRVLGMGSSLDSARLLNLFYKSTQVPIEQLEGFVFGPHSNEMIVSPGRMKVKGQLACDVLDEDTIAEVVRRTTLRGGEIVGLLKSKSAHFGPSLAAFSLIDAIAQDKNETHCVSTLLLGEYGLSDVCMGVPCIINRNGISKIVELKILSDEKEKIKKVNDVFSEVRNLLH